MEIFDSHLHLKYGDSLVQSFAKLIEDCRLAGVIGGLIICMKNDPWDFEAVAELTGKHDNFRFAVNPDMDVSSRVLVKAVEASKRAGASALKIHPRLQRINLQSKEVNYLVRQAQDLELPVVICSFDDGSWSRIGLTSDQFLRLADKFPKVKFLWAHAGGHHVLDFMFMARRVSNVFLDSSFTQSYFFKGSVPDDLNYATESLPTRFMFGTDFEQNTYPESVKKLIDFYSQHNKNREAFFETNYKNFLGINE